MTLLLTLLTSLFYAISTNVISETDSLGNEVYNAALTPAECEVLQREADYVQQQMGDSIVVVAPYYHQFTMNAISLSKDSFEVAYNIAKEDLLRQFDAFLETLAPDEEFYIAGFSQGAMMMRDILKHMPHEAYKRCKRAYMMGYRLSRKDILSPRIRPARSATRGKVVSFNTVTRVDKQWAFVSGGAATCINPVNWMTDTMPAELVYQSDTITITLDCVAHVLVADVEAERYYNEAFRPWYNPGCLHTQDLLFYLPYIRRNILLHF